VRTVAHGRTSGDTVDDTVDAPGHRSVDVARGGEHEALGVLGGQGGGLEDAGAVAARRGHGGKSTQ